MIPASEVAISTTGPRGVAVMLDTGVRHPTRIAA
jgi:hypothetical protein